MSSFVKWHCVMEFGSGGVGVHALAAVSWCSEMPLSSTLNRKACLLVTPSPAGSAPTLGHVLQRAEKRKNSEKKRWSVRGEPCRRLCGQQKAQVQEFRNMVPGLSSAMNLLGTLDKSLP